MDALFRPGSKAALIRRDGGALRERLLDSPQMVELVPTLPAATIHALIDRCGLDACGPLLALATPAQVADVLDFDLWRRPGAGLDERFDADRFGDWLEVLVGQGVDVAARMIARLDVDLVAAGLAQHVRIFDIATLEAYVTTDGTDVPAVIERDGGLGCDVAGRRLIPRRADAWNAIVDLLVELDASHPAAFARLMRACTALSNSRSEVDGLDDLLTRAGQTMFELADAREQRREARGFAAPVSARAFLDASRRLRLDAPAPPAAAAPATSSTAVVRLEAGAPATLLHAHLQAVLDRDAAIHATRRQELAWLANALMAGCTLDARPFTPREAADAVVATCSLGLESWPPAWRGAGRTDDFLVGQDLVAVFQVGWTVLHDDVCVAAASGLLDALSGLPRHDAETQAGLDDLRTILLRQLRAGTPWRSRDALDALASLDLVAWTTLLAVIAECPVLPATIDPSATTGRHRVDPSAFAFIAERRQLTAVQAFVRALPGLLRG